MDITKYLPRFLFYLTKVRGYSDKTVETYRIAIEQMLENYEIYTQNETTYLNIMPFRLKIASLNKKAISTKLSAIRSFVKFINSNYNLNIKIKGNESIKVPKTLPKPISDSKIKEVLASCTQKEALIVSMLYGLGLRVSELASIKISDIHSGWIRIKGKGNKVREIPIIPSLQEDIQKYLEIEMPKEYLFEKDGKAMKDTQIRYIVNKVFAKHGIKATPHQLRHSFASALLQEGARISDVSELLGHSSMATTQIYTKLSNSLKLKNYLKAHPLANSKDE